MDEERQTEEPGQMSADEIEALVALVEARVVENLTRIIERIVQRRAQERSERTT